MKQLFLIALLALTISCASTTIYQDFDYLKQQKETTLKLNFLSKGSRMYFTKFTRKGSDRYIVTVNVKNYSWGFYNRIYFDMDGKITQFKASSRKLGIYKGYVSETIKIVVPKSFLHKISKSTYTHIVIDGRNNRKVFIFSGKDWTAFENFMAKI